MIRTLRFVLMLNLALVLITGVDAFPVEPVDVPVQGAETGELHVVIEELKAKLGETPDDIDLLVDLGNAYYDLGLYNEAKQAYLRILEMDQDHAGAHLNLGTVYSDMRSHDDAITEYTLALELNPDDASARSNLGSVYYAKGMYPEAMDQYRLALKIDPDNPEAHFNLGVAFADVQMFDEAITEWERVIEVAPKSSAADLCRDNISMISDFRGEATEEGSSEDDK